MLANCASEVEVGGISEVPNPTAAMSQQSGKSLSALERGHEIYMLRCGECHTYPLPEHAAAQDFAKTLPKMIEHAGLESSDCADVLDYILAVKAIQHR